jgi:hypothetical protein
MRADERALNRMIDHHVATGALVDEGLPGLVGLALGQRLVAT